MASNRINANSLKPMLSADQIRKGIERLTDRIKELKAFDVQSMTDEEPPQIAALSTAVQRTLEKVFGENTRDYERFSRAFELQWSSGIYTDNYPQFHHYQEGIAKNISRAVILLEQAIKTLEEDLSEAEEDSQGAPSLQLKAEACNRSIFIVHGHAEGPREAVARFLERLEFDAIILHEKANQGQTIIEKVEMHSDVGFAIVLLTPDDVGSVKEGALKPRARQNVVLELGYFVGRLGRRRVCALKLGDLEVPSDFAGVAYVPFDEGQGWKSALGKELQSAGYEIDWNKVMK